jgi:hypothetical protein
MRKITLKIARSLWQGKPCKISNTYTDGEKVFLHDNLIAFKRENGLSISMAGWPTVTTRERINGLLSLFGHEDRLIGGQRVRIYQRYGDQYITTSKGHAKIKKDSFYHVRLITPKTDPKTVQGIYRHGDMIIEDQGLIPEAEIDCFIPSVKRRVL